MCACAPTLVSTNEAKDESHGSLSSVLQSTDTSDKLVLMGDLNARMDKDHLVWADVLGRHGTGKMNSNGL